MHISSHKGRSVRGGTGQPQCASQCHPLQIARVRVHISSHKRGHRVSDSTTGTESSKTAVFLMANQRVFVSQYESFGVCAVAQETLQTDYKISSRLLGANQHSTFPFFGCSFLSRPLVGRTKRNTNKKKRAVLIRTNRPRKILKGCFTSTFALEKKQKRTCAGSKKQTARSRDCCWH